MDCSGQLGRTPLRQEMGFADFESINRNCSGQLGRTPLRRFVGVDDEPGVLDCSGQLGRTPLRPIQTRVHDRTLRIVPAN